MDRLSYPRLLRRSEFIDLDPKQVISLFRAVAIRPPKFNEKKCPARYTREKRKETSRAR